MNLAAARDGSHNGLKKCERLCGGLSNESLLRWVGESYLCAGWNCDYDVPVGRACAYAREDGHQRKALLGNLCGKQLGGFWRREVVVVTGESNAVRERLELETSSLRGGVVLERVVI